MHGPFILVESSWRAIVYVNDNASKEQKDAPKAFTGKAGGPVADLVKLIGEVVDVRRAPINFTVQEGKGLLKIGDNAYAELESFRGATGANTTLSDTIAPQPTLGGHANDCRKHSSK